MNRTAIAVVIGAAAGAILALRGRRSDAAAQSTPKARTLLKDTASWNGVPYEAYPAGRPELTVVRMTIAAGAGRRSKQWLDSVHPQERTPESGNFCTLFHTAGRRW